MPLLSCAEMAVSQQSASSGSRDIHGHRWPSRSVHPRVYGKARGRATPVRNPYGFPTAAHCGRSVPRAHSRAFAAEKFPVRQPFQKATTRPQLRAVSPRIDKFGRAPSAAAFASYQRVPPGAPIVQVQEEPWEEISRPSPSWAGSRHRTAYSITLSARASSLRRRLKGDR